MKACIGFYCANAPASTVQLAKHWLYSAEKRGFGAEQEAYGTLDAVDQHNAKAVPKLNATVNAKLTCADLTYQSIV